jgi:hypothetical protein
LKSISSGACGNELALQHKTSDSFYSNATMLMILIMGLIAGPAMSL